MWATITCCMAAFSNKEYVASIKSDPGFKKGERIVSLKIAERMHDDVIAEAYHTKKQEQQEGGLLKRTTSAQFRSLVGRAMVGQEIHQLERRMNALVDRASPALDH